jgi:hypothetical protein
MKDNTMDLCSIASAINGTSQIGRNLTDAVDGSLKRKRYMIRS